MYRSNTLYNTVRRKIKELPNNRNRAKVIKSIICVVWLKARNKDYPYGIAMKLICKTIKNGKTVPVYRSNAL